MFIEVLIELKAQALDKTFTYKVNDELKDKIKIGIRVLVPFGNKELEGFVLNISNKVKYDYEIKEIINIIDDEPVLNKEMLEMGKYISGKTLSTLISAYQTMLPVALKAKKGTTINKKYITYLKLKVANLEKYAKTENAKKVLELFKVNDYVPKKEAMMISAYTVNSFLKKEIVEEIKEEEYRLNIKCKISNNPIKLSDTQIKVINNVKQALNTFTPFLIYGVTGSGKTEVYINLITEVLKNNKEAIVLVPEISLTPQFIEIFKCRFGDKIAILHSKLSDGEKYDEWRKIIRKEVSIVVGARSAIFAPFPNLGIIIIDEEHSDTYKQENNPRYHVIDIAIFRAKYHNCPLVLGSATPSIESYTRAKTGVYKLLEMKTRVSSSLPKIHLIDMKEEIKKGNRLFSELLSKKIDDRLSKKEQIIILLNRRGYTTIVTCNNCGYTDKCPKCDIPLTYHKKNNIMRCHYCGLGKPKISKCSSCNSTDINEFGMGTEKLEQELKNRWINAKVIRMDIDTTRNKGAHDRIIKAFKNEDYDILIGTQMIAKGLDFPNVTLVGVINGDASLNIPDFRSSERTFALLSQVSGRAGRSKKEGEVIIQGSNIDHYSILRAKNHDYVGFYNDEMKVRQKLGYPPYYNLCVIRLKASDEDKLLEESKKVTNYLKNNLVDVLVLGPSIGMIPKLNNIYNMQIILKYKKKDAIIAKLIFIQNKYKSGKVRLEIDINPLRI